MDPVNLFSIASKHNRWLSVRESAVAQNIANVNTPGYKALDVEPFEAALAATRLAMARTRPEHLNPAGENLAAQEMRNEESWQILHSGNNVNLEQQLMKSGEISGSYALNTSVLKTFHRLLLTSSKG